MKENRVKGRPDFLAEELVPLVENCFGLKVTIKPLAGEYNQNFKICDKRGNCYILKIFNRHENYYLLEAQTQVLDFMTDTELHSFFPRIKPAKNGNKLIQYTTNKNDVYYFQMLDFLPGKLMADLRPFSSDLLTDLGRFLGRLDLRLQDFFHPAAERKLVWDISNSRELVDRLDVISNPEKRRLLDHFLLRFETEALPVLKKLPGSVIHNDANDYNLLSDGKRVTGLIDFGDMVFTQTVNELAVALAYVMMELENPLEAAKEVIKGFNDVFPLTESEVGIIYYLVTARLCTSVVQSAGAKLDDARNRYRRISEKMAWSLLEKLFIINPLKAQDGFRSACGMESIPASGAGFSSRAFKLRQQYISPALSIHYQRPLNICFGTGQYLFDESGRTYLDLVNNVCHVGHCHPRVVRAAQKQIARLNTNTRYLYDQLGEYARLLSATFPDPLRICFFTCTGSEANDLALRMARIHTGGSEAIVVDMAYHGNTSAVIELSPYKFDRPGGHGITPYVYKVPTPDTYRGEFQQADSQSGSKYAEYVRQVVEEIKNRGKRPMAFFSESLMGCAGQVIPPPGYLKSAYQYVREAGGVCVADEVQVGFGRVGSNFWGFEIHGVVPDIVTLGKPIGNGHPLAAVITTIDIARSFNNGMEYFNTFGGNPVSCQVGLEVLQVIKEEKLQENARKVGQYLLKGLKNLQKQHEMIGDVRGVGLFIGVELVKDRLTKEPAIQEAVQLIEKMKDYGILLTTDGPYNNVLKIKPPLVFNRENALFLLEILDRVLEDFS